MAGLSADEDGVEVGGAFADLGTPMRAGDENVRRGVGGETMRDLKDQPEEWEDEEGVVSSADGEVEAAARAMAAVGGGSSEAGVFGAVRAKARASKRREM